MNWPRWMRGDLRPDFTIPAKGGAPPGHNTISPDDYLHRWYIIPRNRIFCVYLHKMMHDDDDRGLHDHPGDNVSIILRGGYHEVMFTGNPEDARHTKRWVYGLPTLRRVRRKPGHVIYRRAATAHRLELPYGVSASWPLFLVFPKYREWGFWLDQPPRWVPWHEASDGT